MRNVVLVLVLVGMVLGGALVWRGRVGDARAVAPQVQVFFVSMQIKPVVTVLIVFTCIHLLLNRITGEYGVMFRWLKQALYLLT